MYDTLINVEDLLANYSNPDWVVFDCRFTLGQPTLGQSQYDEAHIPGAWYANLDLDLAAPKTESTGRHPLPDPAEFIGFLGSRGVDAQTQIVAYDQGPGAIAARLWWMLRWLGHSAVAVLDGGFKAWVDADGPTDARLPEPRSGGFTAEARRSDWVTTEELEGALGEGGVLLLDARESPRFRGEKEPIDPVAGHVPGAVNAPFAENLSGSGFKEQRLLRDRFVALLADARPEQVIHMCGSGVTACHNLLAMEAAGLTGSRLYPGSWSEWITNSERQVIKN